MKFLHEFMTWGDGTKQDNGWGEIVGDKLVNRVGGWHEYIPAPDDIIVEADNWADLDWSCLLNPNSPYGWIDKDGNFYGCNHFEHASLAELYFKCSERALEDSGFVKLYRSYDGSVGYYVARYLTEKQEETLLEKGVKL